jgi:hypothetical protein
MNEYESVVNHENSDEIICTVCGVKACDAGGLCDSCLETEMEGDCDS